ncbi:hypothetical protein WN55_10681 [Dufourea novaeangliae]|uniref:Uncharacterized protein n=1 Tax=Dufourea novaeangliae TaxID=178035 RepID=A0A154P9G9_DUFNO|nr:hypothetical protein WN55_10681 [Dufourea novaeangliae]
MHNMQPANRPKQLPHETRGIRLFAIRPLRAARVESTVTQFKLSMGGIKWIFFPVVNSSERSQVDGNLRGTFPFDVAVPRVDGVAAELWSVELHGASDEMLVASAPPVLRRVVDDGEKEGWRKERMFECKLESAWNSSAGRGSFYKSRKRAHGHLRPCVAVTPSEILVDAVDTIQSGKYWKNNVNARTQTSITTDNLRDYDGGANVHSKSWIIRQSGVHEGNQSGSLPCTLDRCPSRCIRSIETSTFPLILGRRAQSTMRTLTIGPGAGVKGLCGRLLVAANQDACPNVEIDDKQTG